MTSFTFLNLYYLLLVTVEIETSTFIILEQERMALFCQCKNEGQLLIGTLKEIQPLNVD